MSDRQLKLTVLFGALDKLTGPLRTISSQTSKSQQALRDLNATLKQQRADLKSVQDQMGKSGVATREMMEREAALKTAIDRTTASVKDQRGHLSKLAAQQRKLDNLGRSGQAAAGYGAGALGVGIAAGAPMLNAARDAMRLESAMADVKKVVDLPPKGLEKLNDDLLDLSTRTPMAVEGLTQIAALGARSGVGQDLIKSGQFDAARKELLAFTEGAAKMGIAFDMTAEDAGATMAKWRTAFSLTQSGVASLGDQINALTNTYGGNAAAVTEMITRVGPLGKVAGVSAPQMASMAQLLNSVGVEAEVGGTGIKNMMLALTKGKAATKGQQEAFRSLGLDAQKVAGAMQKDAGGAILDVLKRLQSLPKQDQAGVLAELFGTESIAAIAPMLTNLDQLQENFKLVGDQSRYAGSMTKEYLARIATTEGATGLAGNALRALNIEIGQGMLPVITSLSTALTPLANGVRGWAKDHPKLTQAITLFVSVGAGLLVLLGAMGLAAGLATTAFAGLGIATWAALWPVLAIIAAIALLIAGVVLLYQNWSAVGTFLSGLWNGIMAGLKTALDFIVSAFLNFTPLGLLIKNFQPIMKFIGGWVDTFKNFGANLMSGLIDGIRNKISDIKTMIFDVAGKVVSWFKNLLGIKSPSRVFKGFGGHIAEGLNLGIADSMHKPIRTAALLAAGVATAGNPSAAMPSGNYASAGPAPITINIYATPSQSARDIAAEVEAALRRRDDAKAAARRSSFRDE